MYPAEGDDPAQRPPIAGRGSKNDGWHVKSAGLAENRSTKTRQEIIVFWRFLTILQRKRCALLNPLAGLFRAMRALFRFLGFKRDPDP